MTQDSLHIQIDNVQKVYETRRDEIEAIRSVSMEVRNGEFVSILGPSGCGKSTLLMAIGGLLPVTAGKILIGQEVVTGPRRDTGVVFQSPVLMPWRSLMKNVLFPIETLGLPKKEYESRAA
ncbi:MAG: ATP-binding cassette domain-containing protein, partial [Nitrospinota bacterium]|nr:ATP-binding cassette domain-containing protein [Nitrospinota bacterium]